MQDIPYFRAWCKSVLPIVYDESLSYYEVLCKVIEYINNLIKTDEGIIKDIDELKADLKVVQDWIDNFTTSYAEKIIADYIATMVFFGLTDAGYFVAYIPENWSDIHFGTTGFDTFTELMPEYGHLCLSY